MLASNFLKTERAVPSLAILIPLNLINASFHTTLASKFLMNELTASGLAIF